MKMKDISAHTMEAGDNLSSTLPEEFSKQKGIKTYLLKSGTKNQEIIDLLWSVILT